VRRTGARPGRSRKEREERRIKRQQIDRSYREHVPPQVRAMRQAGWFARVNPEPQDIPFEGDTFGCPVEECGRTFAAPRFLRQHMERRHFPHMVPQA